MGVISLSCLLKDHQNKRIQDFPQPHRAPCISPLQFITRSTSFWSWAGLRAPRALCGARCCYHGTRAPSNFRKASALSPLYGPMGSRQQLGLWTSHAKGKAALGWTSCLVSILCADPLHGLFYFSTLPTGKAEAASHVHAHICTHCSPSMALPSSTDTEQPASSLAEKTPPWSFFKWCSKSSRWSLTPHGVMELPLHPAGCWTSAHAVVTLQHNWTAKTK